MKKTAYEIIMEDRKKLVNKLIENMQNGNLIFKNGWDVTAMRPYNPISDISYLGGNRIRLMNAAIENEYKDPRWMTFKQAVDKGWTIKKGSHGILCEKWIFSKTIREFDEKTGKEVEQEIKLEKPVVNYFIVFNGEQVQGIPALELELIKTDKGKVIEIAQEFIQSSECKIKEVAQDRAYYSPGKDEIVLPLRSAFKSEEAFLATALHEMGHSTGHAERLARDLTGRFGSPSYAREELVAELAAVFTQARLNIKLEGEHFNDHTFYLKSWIKVLQGDPNELFRAAVKAEKASERLYTNYIEMDRREIERLQETKPKQVTFSNLKVILNESEISLGIEDKTTLKGLKAYNFLKNLITLDKTIEQENQKGLVDFTIEYGSYNSGRVIVLLGNEDFGGKENVADALEYRLKQWPVEMIARKERIAKLENTTSLEIVNIAQQLLNKIEMTVGLIRKREALYLKNNNVWEKKLEMDRSKSLDLSQTR